MREKSILLRFPRMPLRQKLIAAGIAIAVGSGFFILSRRTVKQPAVMATVSFDANAARQIEPAILYGSDPAVTLAHSILSDDVMKVLAKQVGVKGDAAKFLSNLKMAQISDKLLRVTYQDADRKLSAAAANLIAITLVAWTPALDTTVPDKTPEPHPTAATGKHRYRQSHHARPETLRTLETRLAAVDEKLSALDAEGQRAHALQKMDASTPAADNERRHMLELQLSTEQKKLDALRERYTDAYPDVETAKESIAGIQEQLASLRPVNHAVMQVAVLQESHASEEQAIQLRQERARLTEAVAAEKKRVAMHSRPFLVDATSQQAPAGLEVYPASESTEQRPFALVRLASDAGGGRSQNSLAWYGALAGIFCGFSYFSFAAWRNHPMLAAPAAVDIPVPMEHSWEEGIRHLISQIDLGEGKLPALPGEKSVVNGKEQETGIDQSPSHSNEIPQAVRENIEKDPKSWMAHTENARIALAGGDLDTAMKEMKLAITAAPEKLKAQLSKIVLQLDRNVDIGQVALPAGFVMPPGESEKRSRMDKGRRTGAEIQKQT